MRRAGTLLILGSVLLWGTLSATGSEAPHEGDADFYWSTGTKDFFGTALETYDSLGTYSVFSSSAPISKVWFTGASGVLSEISWPTIDRRQTRDTQFLVTDGKSFLFEERRDGVSEVEWLDDGVPAFRVTTRDPQNRFSFEKTYFASPDQDAILMKVKFHRFVSGLKVYLLHKPAAGNTGMGDSAWALLRGNSRGMPEGLYAWQEKDAQAVFVSRPLKTAAAAFGGKYDGFQDLAADYKQDYFYDEARDGSVVLMAEISLPEESDTETFIVSLGFAVEAQTAMNVAREAASKYDALLLSYRQDWNLYRSGLADLTQYRAGNPALYYGSIATLKSLEDKTFAGAAVAAPAVPWGAMKKDNSNHYEPRSDDFWNGFYETAKRVDFETAGYELVWIRDLFHSATAFLAAGDNKTPVAMLRYIKKIQLRDSQGAWNYGSRHIPRKGSWAQNTWVNGEPHWKMLQMDQVAQPILLAYHLWKLRAIQIQEFWPMIRDAAEFLKSYGPWTFQERWEETMGLSPNTLAYEISGLSGASEIAESLGEYRLAKEFNETAAAWARNFDGWLYTTQGTVGGGRYYVRSEGSSDPDAPWNPNDDATVKITNDGARVLERSLLDGGFMEWVQLGLKSPLNAQIQTTLQEVDKILQTPQLAPRTYIRYNGDRYGWDERTGEHLSGGAWPLLTAERGLMAVAASQAAGENPRIQESRLLPYIQTLETLATPSKYFPEQRRVDDGGVGQISGAVAPLGWAHAEYIKLLRKRADINP